ncbi:MAG: hypothetical protein ACRCZ0_10205 [Cetobacterium sp.]
MNSQYSSHVGYQNSNSAIEGYFSTDTTKLISSKVTELLRNFYPPGIIVPCERIAEVMNDIYRAYRPSTGDIMTRYSIPSSENPNYVDEMINQVIQVIVNDVQNNLLTEQRNSKLDNWVVLMGDFNKWGLRQHAPIHVREKKPKTMLFNMNY